MIIARQLEALFTEKQAICAQRKSLWADLWAASFCEPHPVLSAAISVQFTVAGASGDSARRRDGCTVERDF